MINDEKISYIFNYLRQNYFLNRNLANLPANPPYPLIIEVVLLLNAVGTQLQKEHFCFLLMSAREVCDRSNNDHHFGKIFNKYNELFPEVCADVTRQLIEWHQTGQVSRCISAA
jgi:hypothetical protein